MSSLPVRRYTPEEYLELERKAEFKSEYIDGEIFPIGGGILGMAGADEAHNLIVTNAVRELSLQLKGRPCRTYPSDMKVEPVPGGQFVYPDVTVVCGEPRFHDERRDMLKNPTVIIEVLSPSTEAYDRGAKFARYRQMNSLTNYLLISTTEFRVEQYVSQPDNQWLLSEVTGEDGSIPIASIGCNLAMSELYDRVEFPPRSAVRMDVNTGKEA